MPAPPRTKPSGPAPQAPTDHAPTDHAPTVPLPRAHVPSAPGSSGLALQVTADPIPGIGPLVLARGELTLLESAGLQGVRHRLVLACAEQGRTVFHVLGAQHLDSTGLARQALSRGLDPAYVLSSSVLARAFTAYQLSVLIEETLPRELAARDDVALVVVADPMTLYTDEDVPRREGLSLARQATCALVAAAEAHHAPVLVVQRPVPDAAFLGLLREASCEHVRVRPHPRGRGRIVERPHLGQRHVIDDPGWGQTRLDAFIDRGRGARG